MPFLDEFAKSFSSTFSTSGWQTREQREYQGAQTEHLRTADELAREENERAIAAEAREAEKHRYELEKGRPLAEAAVQAETEERRQNALLREQEIIEKKWANDPKQRELDNEKTRADIENLRAAGKLNDAQAETILAKLPYAEAEIKAVIDRANAETAGLEADTAKKWMDNEIDYMKTLAPGRLLWEKFTEKYGVPPPAAGFEGRTPREPAIPEQGAPLTENAPEPESSPSAVNAPIPAPVSGAPLTRDRAATDTVNAPIPAPSVASRPTTNAPIPAPSVASAPDKNIPAIPISPTEAPRTPVTSPKAPAAQKPLVSSTGRTLAEYSAMDRQTLASLPPSEYAEYVDMYEDAAAAAISPVTAIPTTAPQVQAPAGRVRAGPTAGPATRSITGNRPEYTEQQAGYSTVRPGPTAGPATRPTQMPYSPAPQVQMPYSAAPQVQAPAGRVTTPPIPPALAPYEGMTREELSALPPEEYEKYVSAYEDYATTLQNAARPGPTAGPATRPVQAPYSPTTMPAPPAGTLPVQAPAGGVTTPPPPPSLPSPRPSRAPAHRPGTPLQPVAPGTPQDPLSNTYRPTGTDVTPPGVAGVSYRPGEGAGNVIEAQAGTRNRPLNERTRGMLEQASAATGYDVRVTSGAQPSTGPNRTGSHRHDEDVGAGDIQLIDRATGKPVSMSTPEGQQAIVEFMRAARDAGATGFGAGTDYMGDTTIHVGFGDPGVWGAGGKGANAPDWLKAGMEGGVGGRPSAIPEGAGSRPAGVARAYAGLQARDMPQMQAAVLAGNIQQESGGNPNSVNEGEGAVGIIQWRMDRLDKLNQFAADNGGDPRSLDTQLDFLMAEGESLGTNQDKAAWQEFMSATTPEAANAALKKFIRYGDESAGTRLEYAENLLRGGGGEIRGERLASEAIRGEGRRMPTPRGEVTPQVKRQRIYETATTASKEGLKAIYAGLETQPGIPTQDRNAQLMKVAANADAPPPAEMRRAREAVQKTVKEPMSEAELNAATLAYAYDWALLEGDKDKAALVAKELLQTYTNIANQYMSFAQIKAQNGQLDEAAQIAVKAYAFIPDGKEATVTKEGENFIVTTKDPVTDKLVQQQVLTPNQMMAGIMGWQGTADVHRRLRAAAGETVPSREFEAAQGQITAPIDTAPIPGQWERQAIPTATSVDVSQMTDKEQGEYRMQLGARNTQIGELNKAMQRPEKPEARENIDAQLQRIQEAELATGGVTGVGDPTGMGAQLAPLREVYGQQLNSIFSNMLQANPTEVAETVVNDLANAVAIAKDPNSPKERLPMQSNRGDYEGTWKVKFEGSPTEYNLPSETAETIRSGILAAQSETGQAFVTKLGDYARNAPSIAREQFDKQAAEAFNKTRERYTPGALQQKAQPRQGTTPYGPPIRHMPGYKPVAPPYSEALPISRR